MCVNEFAEFWWPLWVDLFPLTASFTHVQCNLFTPFKFAVSQAAKELFEWLLRKTSARMFVCVWGTYICTVRMYANPGHAVISGSCGQHKHSHTHKGNCSACDHLVVLWPICISGWVISAPAWIPPQAALQLPFPFPPSAFPTIRHACACSFGCEATMSGGAQPFSACYYVVVLSQTNDCVCAVCTRLCVCVCEFSSIPCGYCHSACR